MFDHPKEETMPVWIYNYCDPIELTTLVHGKDFTVFEAYETYWYLALCPVAEA
jgi:hypothetical protein